MTLWLLAGHIFLLHLVFFFPLRWVGQDPLASGCATAACSFSWSHKEYHSMAIISYEARYVFFFFFRVMSLFLKDVFQRNKGFECEAGVWLCLMAPVEKVPGSS